MIVDFSLSPLGSCRSSHLSEIVVRGSGLGRLGHVIHLHHRLLVVKCPWLVDVHSMFSGMCQMCLLFFSLKCVWKRATPKGLASGYTIQAIQSRIAEQFLWNIRVTHSRHCTLVLNAISEHIHTAIPQEISCCFASSVNQTRSSMDLLDSGSSKMFLVKVIFSDKVLVEKKNGVSCRDADVASTSL